MAEDENYQEALRRIAKVQASSASDLSLEDLALSSLPFEIANLKRLKKLDISGNMLENLPDWLGDLTEIEELILGRNRLKTIPEWIVKLEKLGLLDIRNNKSISIPNFIGNINNLFYLDIGDNNLTTLPEWIGRLNNLLGLDLSKNKLSALPIWLAALTELRLLDIRGNELTALPEWLGYSKSLEEEAGATQFFGLKIEGNPLPAPYPTLIAAGQPEATINVLAYLRGELDAATLSTGAPLESENEPAADLAQVTLQRPAAYRFAHRGSRIDAVPEPADPSDAEVAADLLAELRDKARDLDGRLAAANAHPRVGRSVGRLLDALAGDPPRPGVLLSRSRSVEADRDAFDTPEGRAELFPDAIAQINDLLLSLQDVLAVYPVVRRIEAERLALDLQRDPASLDAAAGASAAIASAAAASDVATPGAVAALTVADAALADAATVDLRAGLVADKILIASNFMREAVRAADKAGWDLSADLTEAEARAVSEAIWRPVVPVSDALDGTGDRSMIAELGRRTRHEILENLPAGIGDVARVAPLVALTAFLSLTLGNVAALAALVVPLKSLVGAIKTLRSRKPTEARAATGPIKPPSPKRSEKSLAKPPARMKTRRSRPK